MLRAWLDFFTGMRRPESRGMVVQECEDRILYSADLHPAVWSPGHAVAEVRMIDAPAATLYSPWQASESQQQQQQQQPHEIVFVDDKVANADALIDAVLAARGGGAHVEVIRINSFSSGLQQISDALLGEQNLQAIHIISHGSSGSLELGQGTIESGTLYHESAQLNTWRGALSPDADIMLYGCDVAAGAEGQEFIEQLARATDADVAASLDATGNAAQGGNWDLEAHIGSIETAYLLTGSEAPNWQGLLATFTVINTSDSGAGSLRQAITDANANANANGTGSDNISFGIAGTGVHTITLSSLLLRSLAR